MATSKPEQFEETSKTEAGIIWQNYLNSLTPEEREGEASKTLVKRDFQNRTITDRSYNKFCTKNFLSYNKQKLNHTTNFNDSELPQENRKSPVIAGYSTKRIDQIVSNHTTSFVQKTSFHTTNLEKSAQKTSFHTTNSMKVVKPKLEQWSFLYLLKSAKLSDCFLTERLSIKKISKELEIKARSAQEIIRRLIKKGLVIRKEWMDGKYGWTVYQIPKYIMESVQISSFHTTNSAPVSSSLFNITTGEKKEKLVSSEEKSEVEEWNRINYDPLKQYGFGTNQIRQLRSRKIFQARDVQEFINRFAWDLTDAKKRKKIKDPISYFMGIVGKGIFYESSPDYPGREK